MGKKDTARKAAMAQKPQEAARKKTSWSQNGKDVVAAVNTTYNNYVNTLSGRLKLIDVFLVFLVALGVLQFVYVLIIGNFPFNAFLGGFIACVGQFVLTVSLRMQYASVEPAKKEVSERPFSTISPERAFGDYVFASLILHFIVFHFIN